MILAHAEAEYGGGGVLDGLLHPLTGYDHLVVMIAVGIASAFALRRHGRVGLALPLAFAGALLTGAGLGVAGAGGDWAESFILASVVAVPVLLAVARTSPGPLIVAVASAGLFHGLAHGMEAPASAELGFLAGMIVATLALHGAGFAVAARLAADRRGRAVLVAAGAVAAAVVVGVG